MQNLKLSKLILQKATQDIRRYADLGALLISAELSSLLIFGRFDFFAISPALPGTLIFVGVSYLVLLPFVLRERNWRMVSAYDAVRLTQAVSICFVLFLGLHLVTGGEPQFVRWIFSNAFLSLALLCGLRLARRMVFERRNLNANAKGRRTLIIGTGIASCSLAARFAQDASVDMHLIGFITHDPKLVRSRISGFPVLGVTEDFPQILAKHGIKEVIITEAPDCGLRLRDLLQQAQNFGIKPKMMTHFNFSNKTNIGNEGLREVALSDLLRRPRVEVDLGPTKNLVQGQTVMVTGAGGSIGSELVRQLIQMNPKSILLLDQAEFNLYSIDSELKSSGLGVSTVPILSDLKEPQLLRKVMKAHAPSLVFHAAAYKHVHLVEANVNAAILNNIVSTKNLLDACVAIGVGHFIMISSDKAVNPRGIMGATKRACEMLVTEVGESTNLPYCSVRFGNVLGSSGSFIPLLTKQIQAGGPVTITHPEMERYFMLIPEAVSLVLKTVSISKPGDINLLKMGSSIKIMDIAKSLILLMGKNESDIPFIFTGTRPGEKLREELYLSGDEVETQHPDIVVLPRGGRALDSIGIHESLEKTVYNSLITIQEIIERARSGEGNVSEMLYKLVESKGLNFIEGKAEVKNENEKRSSLVA